MSTVNNAGWRPLGTDDAYRYTATTLSVYWPEAEHERLIKRWPHLVADVGATWDEHRGQIERHCALVERASHTICQTGGSVADFEAFLAERHVTTPSRSDLQAYPDLRTQPISSAGHRHVPVRAGAARAASTSCAVAPTAWAVCIDARRACSGAVPPPAAAGAGRAAAHRSAVGQTTEMTT